MEFNYHLTTVIAYAFYIGQVRGLVSLLETGYITAEEFIVRQRAADKSLQEKLSGRDAG